jgi:hypothetical protein
MAFQDDPHIFTDRPTVRTGQLGQIVIEGFREM